MPIYEYRCRDCGQQIEVMQRISDEPLSTCEACGGELKKLISAPAFQFKGSGWYVTDYARKSNGKGADAKPAGESSGGAASDGAGSKDAGAAKDSGKSAAKDSGTTKNGSATKSSSTSS